MSLEHPNTTAPWSIRDRVHGTPWSPRAGSSP